MDRERANTSVIIPVRLFGIELSRWSQSAESAFFRGMDLVGTDCSDEDVRDAVIDAAGGNTSAIEEALTHVQDMWRESQSYATDRALRVFTAAVQRSPVPPVDSAHAEFYERERRLERLPRDVAIAELSELSPAIKRYCDDVLRKKRGRYRKFGLWRSARVELRIEKEVDGLVGPESDAHEPLLRSSITAGVVMSWIRDVTELATARTDD